MIQLLSEGEWIISNIFVYANHYNQWRFECKKSHFEKPANEKPLHEIWVPTKPSKHPLIFFMTTINLLYVLTTEAYCNSLVNDPTCSTLSNHHRIDNLFWNLCTFFTYCIIVSHSPLLEMHAETCVLHSSTLLLFLFFFFLLKKGISIKL